MAQERDPDVAAEDLVPADPATWSDRLHQRPGRLRTLLVVLPVLAGLVAAGLVGRSLLFPEEETSEAAEGASCWDGSAPASASGGCPAPEGVRGLRWVFPSFRPGRLDCVDDLERDPRLRRPVMWTCVQRVGGREVEVTYSEVTDHRSALRYLDDLHGKRRRSAATLDDAQVVRWGSSPLRSGGWTASVLLKALPYAVTVRTQRRTDTKQVLRRKVDVRAEEELQRHRP